MGDYQWRYSRSEEHLEGIAVRCESDLPDRISHFLTGGVRPCKNSDLQNEIGLFFAVKLAAGRRPTWAGYAMNT